MIVTTHHLKRLGCYQRVNKVVGVFSLMLDGVSIIDVGGL